VFYVNGNVIQNKNELTVEQFLMQEGYELKFVAVEYNGAILPKEKYAYQSIKENDVLEVVSFVGGG
jgi:sulfur carrier protein